MKPLLLLLLGLSLAANAALYVKRSASPGAAPANASAATSTPANATNSGSPAPSNVGPESPAKRGEQIPADLLAQLAAGDPAAKQRLRDLGFPSHIIRALLISQVNELFRDREKALQANPGRAEFWKSNYQQAMYTPTDRMALIDLRREKTALLKQLLGDDYYAEANPQDSRLPGAAPEKLEQLRWIEEDYNALTQQIRGDTMNTILLAEDRAKLAYLEKEKRNEIAQLLSPEELRTYELRSSRTANQLRYSLSAFQPTEEEFIAIFDASSELMPLPGLGRQPRSEREAYNQAQQKLNERLKATLGEERFAEYTRSQDYNYRQLHEIGTQLKLPKETTIAVYDSRKKLIEKINAQRPDGTPDGVKKVNETRAALAREFEAEAIRLLGQEAYDTAKKTGLFNELQFYTRPMPVPTPRPPATSSSPAPRS